jgi:glycyl-tRNA synthetase
LTLHREKLSVELKSAGKISIDVPGVGSQVELTPDLVVIEKRTRTEHVRSFVPNVIEPSFGVSHFCPSALHGRTFFVSSLG